MITDYVYVGLLLVFGIGFVSAAFIISWMLRPHRPSLVKNSTYECGEVVKGSPWIQFNVRYYLIALVFVIFDVEILFLVPWVTIFRELGLTAYIEMMIFIALLVFGLVYAWKKGVLEWQ